MLKIPVFVLVTIVATFNLSLAQSQNDSSSNGQQAPNFFGLPFPFQIPQFPHFHLPFFREQEAGGPPADAPADASANGSTSSEDQDGHQDRFFFHLFHPVASYVSCNYTSQAGSTCTSCTTALSCGTSNVGRLRACRGFFPYCNLGRCSPFPGELCVNATG